MVRVAAQKFGHQEKAAALLLDKLPVKYRVSPEDEPLRETLAAEARAPVETAQQLAIVDDDGDAVVARVLYNLVRELGFIRAERGSRWRSDLGAVGSSVACAA